MKLLMTKTIIPKHYRSIGANVFGLCVRQGLTPQMIIKQQKFNKMTKVSKKHRTPADAKPVLVEGTGSRKVQWRVNTPQLLKEIIGNNETAVLSKPLAIFGRILAEVGERASELNDPKLNALMCRLAIYEVSDPYNANYNAELTNATIEAGL